MRVVILHYHIFKNAGSSLDASFKNWLGEARYATKEFSGSIKACQQQIRQWIIDKPDVVCFSSHSMRTPPPEIEGIKILPVVFIRHPIDRIASAYEFERKQGSDTYGSALARNTDLSGYIEVQMINLGWNQVVNFQCHRLAHLSNEANQSLFEKARRVIDSLPFVGVVENYALSIKQLEGLLKDNGFLDVDLKVISKNRNEKRDVSLQLRLLQMRSKIKPDIYQKLLTRNQEDIDLYEYITGKPVFLFGSNPK